MGVIDTIKKQWKSGDVVIRLIMVNAGVFIFLKLLLIIALVFNLNTWNVAGNSALTWNYLASTSNIGSLVRRPWSIVTYMFVHEGLWHIAMNMLILYFAGRIFLSQLSGRRLLSTYFLGGFAGLALYILAYNTIPALSGQPSVIWGASAAVMAVFIAIAAYYPNYSIRLPFIGSVPLKYVALFYILLDVIGVTQMSNTGGHIGHLGGAAYGFFYAYYLQRNKDINAWFENLLDLVIAFLTRKSRMKVVHKKGPVKSARGMKDEDYNQRKASDKRKIDLILDKISKGGYDSLSKKERDFLNQYSDN